MFPTILVPLDGSTFAEQALPLALTLGKRSGGIVRLLRVVPPLADSLFMPPLLGDPLDAQLRQLHRADAQDYLDSVVNRLQDAGQVICDVMEEEEGVSESICADVVRKSVDLIIMTSHGRGALARFWLGSIADQLVRTAPVPVLLVRPPENPPAAELGRSVQLDHFLLALAGDTMAERIVEPALAIGKVLGAHYTLVRVVRPVFPHLTSRLIGLRKVDEQNCQKAEDYLRTVADRLRAGGATVQTRVHVAEQPAAAILQEAAQVGANLIALETHGRGASRLLFGSVADKIVRGSSLPVLVCRLPFQEPRTENGLRPQPNQERLTP
jgi:nucleotide-binding universal stress UspA family protein